MFSLLITVTLAAIVAVNAEPTGDRPKSFFPSGRIVGGANANITSYPHQISLERLGRHTCGGSIISSRHVLTAGHCVGAPPSQLGVRAGTSLKGQGGSVHKVSKIIRHEEYGTNGYGVPTNDVAILVLASEIKFDKNRQPVKLYNASEAARPGAKAVITGWGSTGTSMPTRLQTVDIPIVSKELCGDAYKSYGGLPEGQICAAYYGQGGKDSCQGDSGGPLTIAGRLAGIVSWGNGCAKAYYPGVYTEVAYFRKWIDEHADFY